MNNIPLFDLSRSVKSIKKQVLAAWDLIIDSTEFTYGAETAKFEKSFAKLCNCEYALGTSSGTDSLLIALKALNISPGDEVITTPLTFAATGDAVQLTGATAVFTDVDSQTGNIDPNQIAAHITSKTKAILVVHLYGVPAAMNEINKIASQHNISVIEDASHAHGSYYRNYPVGGLGDVGCFSLYPSKSLGAFGNAGVVVTNHKKVFDRIRSFSQHGVTDPNHKYLHAYSGFNARINNLQAAVLNIKMASLFKIISKKIAIAKIYNDVLLSVKHTGMVWPSYTQPSLYTFAVQVADRQQFREFFASNGVSTGVYYPVPLHLQQSFQHLGYKKGDLPQAELFARQTVSLPLYANLTDTEVNHIANLIQKFFSSN